MSKLLQPLIDKYESWCRSVVYKKGKYFSVHKLDSGRLAISLLKSKFKGIIYSYGAININEDLGHKGARASFDIDIIEGDQELINNDEFCRIVGQILLSVLEEVIYNQAEIYFRENLDEEDREDYIEEPFPKRAVRQKSSPVSERRVPSRKKRKDGLR